jgi:hypothetical protein
MEPTDEFDTRVRKTLGGEIPYRVRKFRCSDPNCAHDRSIEEKESA